MGDFKITDLNFSADADIFAVLVHALDTLSLEFEPLGLMLVSWIKTKIQKQIRKELRSPSTSDLDKDNKSVLLKVLYSLGVPLAVGEIFPGKCL